MNRQFTKEEIQIASRHMKGWSRSVKYKLKQRDTHLLSVKLAKNKNAL